MTNSIVSRVVFASLLAALISALVLAAAASLTAGLLWQDAEITNLRVTAATLVHAIPVEELENHQDLQHGAQEAISELPAHGYRVEVWRGTTLIAGNMASAPLGPFTRGARRKLEEDWLIETLASPDGLLVAVAEPRDLRRRELSVFYRSMLFAAPFCALFAVAVGIFFGRRAIRPLVAFTRQIAAVDQLESPPFLGAKNAPVEVRDLEESFRELFARLSRSLRREIEFAANASHELRTPLTRMRLHAERALQDAGPAASAEIRSQIAELDQMVRLVDSLLVLARDVESGLPIGEPVNLADVARECHRRSGISAGHRDLSAPDEAMVRGDEELLSIAIENLVDNARKYSPAGYSATMCSEPGGEVEFTIVSEGVVTDEGVDERLFERFFREESARARHPGHGLGLSLARHIARLHGGDLRYEIRQPSGLAFVLTLPEGGSENSSEAADRRSDERTA